MDETTREIAKMGVEFARDLAQQLITLSTGILALTITFTKDILNNASGSPTRLLKLSWIVYLISICFGIWTMMALTGTLAPLASSGIQPSLAINLNVRLPAALQVLSFLGGIILIIIFGAMSLRRRKADLPDSNTGKG